MATAENTVLPIGREWDSVSDLLAVIARHLEGQDKVRFEIHAMGTALEGEPEDIFALAAKIHALPFDSGIPRVYTILKIDQRTDKEQTLESKVRAVTDRL